MGREEAGRSRPPTPRVRRVLAGEGGRREVAETKTGDWIRVWRKEEGDRQIPMAGVSVGGVLVGRGLVCRVC
jgi:hypothetical protein